MSFWILFAGLLLLAGVGLLFWQLPDRRLVLLALLIVLATIGGIAIDQMIVTDTEAVRDVVRRLARGVARNDVAACLEEVSDKAEQCRQSISSEMPTYEFRTCHIIAFSEVEFRESDPRSASIIFRVLVDVTAPSYQFAGMVTRDVTLYFRKEDDDRWRIVGYRHRSPSNQPWTGDGEIGPGPEPDSGF